MHISPCMGTNYRGVINKQGPTYYCESLHFTSHTLEHNCASAIYFQAPSEQAVEKCRFVYYHNHISEPKILETQTLILLSNLSRPWQLMCRSQTEHPLPMASSPYAVIKREDLSLWNNCPALFSAWKHDQMPIS